MTAVYNLFAYLDTRGALNIAIYQLISHPVTWNMSKRTIKDENSVELM
jgi:hypothetical protein